jgi:2-keto-3-deoxy-L-rhamnonate aldolase RhmA
MPADAFATRTGLRDRVRGGEVTFGAFASTGSATAAELLGRSGLDWVILDLEHGALTETGLLAGIHALQTTPATALVRVEESARLRIGRALDFGAEGLMIPRLETPAEVRAAIDWMRFPPDGIRGVALPARGAGMGEVAHRDVGRLNARPLGIFQVESPLAVANAAGIAAIDGVDVLFVGPADLSHAMGIPGEFTHPDFVAALGAVCAACRDHGKAAGILLMGAAEVGRHLGLGFRFLGIGADGPWIREGAVATLRAARAQVG